MFSKTHISVRCLPSASNAKTVLWRILNGSRHIGQGALATTTATATRMSQICIFSGKKTMAMHALQVRFSFLSISLPSSAKKQRKITKFEVLWKTSAL